MAVTVTVTANPTTTIRSLDLVRSLVAGRKLLRAAAALPPPGCLTPRRCLPLPIALQSMAPSLQPTAVQLTSLAGASTLTQVFQTRVPVALPAPVTLGAGEPWTLVIAFPFAAQGATARLAYLSEAEA